MAHQGVLHSFSIKNIFHDKMNLKGFIFMLRYMVVFGPFSKKTANGTVDLLGRMRSEKRL